MCPRIRALILELLLCFVPFGLDWLHAEHQVDACLFVGSSDKSVRVIEQGLTERIVYLQVVEICLQVSRLETEDKDQSHDEPGQNDSNDGPAVLRDKRTEEVDKITLLHSHFATTKLRQLFLDVLPFVSARAGTDLTLIVCDGK